MSYTFKQGDSQWGGKPYPGGSYNLSNSGCGPTSIATILANSINSKITPVDTWQYMHDHHYVVAGQGSTWAGMSDTLKHFGINAVHISSPSASSIFQHMNKGHRYAILLFSGGTQGGITWTLAGHFVASTGYKVENGKHWFYTRDPGGRNNDGWHCYEDTMSKLLCGIWICTSDKYPEKFKVEATKGDPGVYNGTSAGTFNDAGQGMSLEKQVSKLYSSDNYQFIKETDSQKPKQTAVSIVRDALNKLQNPLTESSANNIAEAQKLASKKAVTAILDKLMSQTLVIDKQNNPVPVKTKGNLLSYSNFVEAPVILLNMNGVLIGGYGNSGDKYPNYITSMQVQKTSGKINRYIINLSYQVREGEDPNFIDKLLSRTGFTNKIQIIYGDANGSKIFRDDNALIMDVSFTESVSSKRINYTITAVSSIVSAVTTTTNFTSKTEKPSTLINDLFYSTNNISQTMLDAFSGMANKTIVNSLGLIPTNDEPIITQSRLNVSPIAQLSYYVAGMYNSQNNSNYYLTYHDDTMNELGGPYIKITEIGDTSTDTLAGNYFELDVGYPGDNFVTNFTLNNDVYFPLVYKYNGDIPNWSYDIDNEGNLFRTSTNQLLTNNVFNKRNVIQSNWWKRVTEYPVSAEVTVKGLIKPVLITSYVQLNVLFYGSTDLASGLYAIMGQTDNISNNGYSTTLSLLRVGRS